MDKGTIKERIASFFNVSKEKVFCIKLNKTKSIEKIIKKKVFSARQQNICENFLNIKLKTSLGMLKESFLIM